MLCWWEHHRVNQTYIHHFLHPAKVHWKIQFWWLPGPKTTDFRGRGFQKWQLRPRAHHIHQEVHCVLVCLRQLDPEISSRRTCLQRILNSSYLFLIIKRFLWHLNFPQKKRKLENAQDCIPGAWSLRTDHAAQIKLQKIPHLSPSGGLCPWNSDNTR